MNSTGLYMKELCRLLVPLLHSPLSAYKASAVMVELGTSAFDDQQFGKGLLIVMFVTCKACGI